MKEVKVNKAELLTKVKINKEKHIEEFNKSIEVWKLRATEGVEATLNSLDSKHFSAKTEHTEFPTFDFDFKYDRPICHLKDYDRAISMLEMSQEVEVSIGAKDFDQLVNDEWGWKGEFTASNTKYR